MKRTTHSTRRYASANNRRKQKTHARTHVRICRRTPLWFNQCSIRTPVARDASNRESFLLSTHHLWSIHAHALAASIYTRWSGRSCNRYDGIGCFGAFLNITYACTRMVVVSLARSLSLTLFLSYVCVCVCCWTLNHYLSIFFLYFYSLNSLRNCHSPYNYINISTMQRAQGTNIGTAIVFIHWLQCRYIHSCLAACLLLNTFRSKLFTTRLNEPLSNGRTGHSHCHWDHDHSNTHFIVNSSDIPRICLFCALMINTLHLCVLSLIGHLNGKYKIEQNSTNITD